MRALAIGLSLCGCSTADGHAPSDSGSIDAGLVDSAMGEDAMAGDLDANAGGEHRDASVPPLDGATPDVPKLDAQTPDASTQSDAGEAGTRARETLVFVGGSTMVQVFSLKTDSGTLVSIGQVDLGPNPSYLVASADGRFLYAANEADGSPGVTTAAIGAGGQLTKLATRVYAGAGHNGLVYVTLDPSGKYLLAADYNGGHAAVFPVQADGTVGAAVDDESFGAQANTHSVRVHRSGKWAYVPNKGLDSVAQFAFDQATGKLTPLTPASAPSADGARHIALHPTAEFAYVLNENDATLRAFSIAATGQLSQIDQKPTLPASFTGTNSAAHVLMHPSGRFVYASNRGYDRIAVFGVDADGKLALVENTVSPQKPRDFDIDQAGAFLIAAGQGDSKVIVYAIGQDGKLTARGQPTATVSAPAAVAIVTRDAI